MTHIDLSSLALKSNFPNLKTKVDKLDIDKLAPVPYDLAKLSNVVKNDVIKKTEYDKFFEKVHIIDITGFLLKTAYDTYDTDHNHDKHITTSEFNKVTAEIFKVRLAQGDLVTKTDFDTKLKILNKKVDSSKTKHLLVENKLKKLKKLDLRYFRGKNYFGNDSKNYLVFEASLQCIKLKYGDFDGAPYKSVVSWISAAS